MDDCITEPTSKEVIASETENLRIRIATSTVEREEYNSELEEDVTPGN